MKKKLIKRLEELAVENEQLKNIIEEHVIDCFKEKFKENIFEQINDTGVVLDGIMGSFKDCGKEEEVWWLCNEDLKAKCLSGYEFTYKKGSKYKQKRIEGGLVYLIDDNGYDYGFWFLGNPHLTKIEENKELEEAKEVVKDWCFGQCSYSSNEIDKAIETILSHLENEKKN